MPILSKAKNKAQETIDFNNTRQTMLATHLYAGDDEDYLPHPTWGSNGSGPDGWAYGTEAMSRVTGPVSAARLSIQESNQVQAFRTGQLASYLGFTHKALMCPTDAVESRDPSVIFTSSVRSRSSAMTGTVRSGDTSRA